MELGRIGSFVVGAMLASSVGVLAASDEAAKLKQLLPSVAASRVDVHCDGDVCAARIMKAAKPSAEAAAVGVQPLSWEERAVCPVAAVDALLVACGAPANEQKPAAFFAEGEKVRKLELDNAGKLVVVEVPELKK